MPCASCDGNQRILVKIVQVLRLSSPSLDIVVVFAVASQASRASGQGAVVGTPGCTKVLWHQFSRQYTPGHRTVFSVRFTLCVFIGLCIFFFTGGSILLSQSLSLVQLRVVYSDAPPMSSYSNQERSLLLQGQGECTSQYIARLWRVQSYVHSVPHNLIAYQCPMFGRPSNLWGTVALR